MTSGIRVRITATREIGGLLYVDAEGMAGQSFRKVLVNEAHGMASTPPLGATGWLTMPGGRPDLAYVAHIQHEGHRPSVPAGAAVLYNQYGQMIRILQDDVEIKGGARVLIESTAVEIVSATLTHNGKNIGDSHVHTGVVPGGGNTGAPA